MEKNRREIAPGVYLTCLPVTKFKTSLLSAQFVTKLTAEHAASQALLPVVLRRGTVRYPDMGRLNAALEQLYGAQLDFTVRKKGENQCTGFVACFVDDAYVPDGEKLLEPMAALLGEVLYAPVLENGQFLPEYVDSERTNLVDMIRSMINDKREYADLRLLQEMCAGEAYGLNRWGTSEDAAAVTAEQLMADYRALLSTARLELFYCGSAPQERVEEAFMSAFQFLGRKDVRTLELARYHSGRTEVKQVTETMDVTQGKLGMGFSCTSQDETALLVGNTIFGGSSNSKLFLNVREKLSLCYFASSLYHRSKGMITVLSGIEFDDYQRAYDEILLQLKAVQDGALADWELSGAVSTLLNSYASMGDSLGKMEDFYIGQAATGRTETPEDLADKVRGITAERVFEAMRTVSLDTVYFLKGENAE